MNDRQFESKYSGMLSQYNKKISHFKDGDFGDLTRIDYDYQGILASAEFWSEGWVGFEIVDTVTANSVINKMIGPDEPFQQEEVARKFVELLTK